MVELSQEHQQYCVNNRVRCISKARKSVLSLLKSSWNNMQIITLHSVLESQNSTAIFNLILFVKEPTFALPTLKIYQLSLD